MISVFPAADFLFHRFLQNSYLEKINDLSEGIRSGDRFDSVQKKFDDVLHIQQRIHLKERTLKTVFICVSAGNLAALFITFFTENLMLYLFPAFFLYLITYSMQRHRSQNQKRAFVYDDLQESVYHAIEEAEAEYRSLNSYKTRLNADYYGVLDGKLPDLYDQFNAVFSHGQTSEKGSESRSESRSGDNTFISIYNPVIGSNMQKIRGLVASVYFFRGYLDKLITLIIVQKKEADLRLKRLEKQRAVERNQRFNDAIKNKEETFAALKIQVESDMQNLQADLSSRIQSLEEDFTSEHNNIQEQLRSSHKVWESEMQTELNLLKDEFNREIGQEFEARRNELKALSDDAKNKRMELLQSKIEVNLPDIVGDGNPAKTERAYHRLKDLVEYAITSTVAEDDDWHKKSSKTRSVLKLLDKTLK